MLPLQPSTPAHRVLATINIHTSASAIYGFEVMIAIGAGAYAQAGYAVIQAVVDPADMTNAITFIMIGKLLSRFR